MVAKNHRINMLYVRRASR